MKSEHRHELQTNELGKLADQVGGYFERYANQISIGAIAVSLVAAGTIYWLRSSHARDAAAWRDLAGARRAEDFAAVWESHPDTAAAEWARVQEGEARLTEGIQLAFTNLESAQKELEQARKVLQASVDGNRAPDEARERALFALGRALESLSDGNEGDAVKAYHALVKEFPGSAYRADAEQRIAELESGRGQEFYAWFAKYPRPKAPASQPRDRAAANTSDEELLLPDDDGAPVEKPADEGVQSKSGKADGEEASTVQPQQPGNEPAPAGDEAAPASAGPKLPNP